jgi:hypothetical protein
MTTAIYRVLSLATRLQRRRHMKTRGAFNFTLCILVAAIGFGLAGCGGVTTEPPAAGDMSPGPVVGGDMAGHPSGGTNLPLFSDCTDNSQCVSGLCTKISYDRAPNPICTYMCDAMDQNPKCPMGCNPKGYCKKPM